MHPWTSQYAWALWLAAPVVGITVVSLLVWWWARPTRPATTPASIAGHHAYLDALVRPPRERVVAPGPDDHRADVADTARAVIVTDDAVRPEGVVTVRS